MKFGGYLGWVAAGLVLAAGCSTQLELEEKGAGGEAGAAAEGGEAGEAHDAGGSGAEVGGAPAAGAGGVRSSGGGEGGAGNASGAGGDGGTATATTLVEYEDDFDDVGDWVLEAELPVTKASAEIKDGQLLLFSDQGNGDCAFASADLALPDLKAAPEGTTTVWKFQLVDLDGSATTTAPLVLVRPPRRVTVDLMTLGDETEGELVVTVSPTGVAISFNGKATPWLDFSTGGTESAASISLDAEGCGADLLGLAQVGISRLEITSVSASP